MQGSTGDGCLRVGGSFVRGIFNVQRLSSILVVLDRSARDELLVTKSVRLARLTHESNHFHVMPGMAMHRQRHSCDASGAAAAGASGQGPAKPSSAVNVP
jgi:hypothetical protein